MFWCFKIFNSCWAFAAVEQVESDAMRQLKQKFVLSTQQVTSCDVANFGCDGGMSDSALSFIKSMGGLQLDTDYPYLSGSTGYTGNCSRQVGNQVVTVDTIYEIIGEDNMASYVQSTGPVIVYVAATTWQFYTEGVMTSCGTDVNHAVQAVGVSLGPGGYWKLRNQW